MANGSHTLFRSILPGDEEFVDDFYRREELERMDWERIRKIAATVESDEINGRSEREDMEDFLVGHERVEVDR